MRTAEIRPKEMERTSSLSALCPLAPGVVKPVLTDPRPKLSLKTRCMFAFSRRSPSPTWFGDAPRPIASISSPRSSSRRSSSSLSSATTSPTCRPNEWESRTSRSSHDTFSPRLNVIDEKMPWDAKLSTLSSSDSIVSSISSGSFSTMAGNSSMVSTVTSVSSPTSPSPLAEKSSMISPIRSPPPPRCADRRRSNSIAGKVIHHTLGLFKKTTRSRSCSSVSCPHTHDSTSSDQPPRIKGILCHRRPSISNNNPLSPSTTTTTPSVAPGRAFGSMPSRSHPPPPVHRQRIRFSKAVQKSDTYSRLEYDRASDSEAICSRLTPDLAQQIKDELNEYKLCEMQVHDQSRIYTHFFYQ